MSIRSVLNYLVGIALVTVTTTAGAGHFRVYLLTGQSNSLGTSNGSETDKSPGSDPADAQIKFWWENWGGAGSLIGSCTNTITPLQVQQGGYYAGSATHWGPEFGFGRALWKAGQRDFMIIKCSRGGGGNSYWHKSSADHHMYDYVRHAVSNAVTVLTNQGHTFEISGVLYLQGESNNSTEASEAGARFRALLDNLRADLPNARRMKGYIAGVAKSASGVDINLTLGRHDAVYGQYAPEIVFFSDVDLADEVVPADSLHFNVRAKLAIGARFADAVLGRFACYNADLVATNAENPILQGWSETTNTAATAQAIAGLTPDPGFTNNAWQIDDGSASVRGYYYSRQLSTNQCSWASGLGWALTTRSRLVTGYGGGKAWFIQYGDAVNRWLLWAQLDAANQLVLSWDKDSATLGATNVVVQSNYDGQYHEFAIGHPPGAGAATMLFDGQAIGSTLPIAATGALPSGVHWGTASTAGTVKANWQRVEFRLGGFSLSGAVWTGPKTLQVQFPSQANRTYGLFRSTDLLDWSSVLTNIPGTGAPVWASDTNATASSQALYRVRMNP